VSAGTPDVKARLDAYCADLNSAVESRAFAPFVQKWFSLPDCMLNFHHESEGLEDAKRLWKHLLPTGENVPREVLQFPYKVENGRVYCWRQLQGGNAPKPLYGLQETQFDDRTMISGIAIHSVQDKPEVETDPGAEKSRLGRIFLAFADVFNDYFLDGDPRPLAEWCSSDIRMELDSTFWGMGVMGPHNRIAQTARFSVGSVDQLGDDRYRAQVDFTDWGGLDGSSPWDLTLAPDGKIRELLLTLEM
jgi:hypothetical protein